MLIPIALTWWFFIAQVIFRTPIGDNPAPDVVALVIWLFFGVGLPLFAYYTKLITDVQTDGEYLRFFPLYSRTIALNDIVTYEARLYRPLVEYGRWGIRFGRHNKRATMGGNRGVELELTVGTRVLIGSQRPEELASAVAAAKAST